MERDVEVKGFYSPANTRVAGEAGIDQSRLLSELAELDAVASARLLEGRSLGWDRA